MSGSKNSRSVLNTDINVVLHRAEEGRQHFPPWVTSAELPVSNMLHQLRGLGQTEFSLIGKTQSKNSPPSTVLTSCIITRGAQKHLKRILTFTESSYFCGVYRQTDEVCFPVIFVAECVHVLTYSAIPCSMFRSIPPSRRLPSSANAGLAMADIER